MKTKFVPPHYPDFQVLSLRAIGILVTSVVFILLHLNVQAVTKTSAATGNWSAGATWNPAGVPASGDDVIIHGGHVVTIDGAYTCNDLNVGDATSGITTLKIIAAGKSLTVNGALSLNPGSVNNTYTLDAGPGSISISGTFPTWSTTGTNTIKVAAGTLTFTPAVSITSANQNLTCTGAGTINFNSSFTDSYNKLVTFAGCIINFAGSYTVNTTNASWVGKGTAVFTGSNTITANSNLTLFNVQTATSASTTLASAAGTVIIGGAVTLGSGSTFTASENFELSGNWTNNGGTFSGGSNTVTLTGTTTFTGATDFPYLQLGNNAATVTATLNHSITCLGLTYDANSKARTLTISGGDTLTVNGNVIINQPTAGVTNSLAVNTGTCIITGNLTFSGTTTTALFISKAAVTTGLLSVAGTVSYDANTTVANQVITATTGTITFGSAPSMAYGTLSVTSTGTINFNGTSPSFTFGSSNGPVFTTTNGCTLNFSHGFVNNTNALTLAATSTANFTGTGTITANAALTFGNVQINSSDTLASTGNTVDIAGSFTLASASAFDALQSFELGGSWINNGGTLAGSNDSIFLIGNAQTISGSGSTTFPIIQVGNATSGTVSYTMNNNNSCPAIIFYANNHNNTFTLGSGYTLNVSGDVTINQPSAAFTNNLAVGGGTCIISGNLNLPGTNPTAAHVAKVSVTSGELSVAGNIIYGNNPKAANLAVTVSTGTMTFSNAVTMTTGTLSVTGGGTINFNGPSISFTFGFTGVNAPVFATAAGSKIFFAHGFVNTGNALTFNAASNCFFTNTGSITPNAKITFGNVSINSSDTLLSGAAVIIAGDDTLASGSLLYAEQNFEVRGNWVNNGGTLSGTAYTVFLNGTAQVIKGNPTTFQTLEIGSASIGVNAAATMSCDNTCSALIFHAAAFNRTLTLNSGTTLTVTGNLTINQPTANSMTALLEVSSGTCNVGGNLVFSGANLSATRVSKIDVTSGSFSLTGSVTWGGSTSTAVNVISVSTGTITFSSSVTMGTKSGTMQVTGAGTINFNGVSAPSLSFGGAIAPVFSTVSGSTINIQKGVTANTTPLAFATGSTVIFTGTGTITPNAAISFGNIQNGTGYTLTMAGNISLTGNWTNSGNLVPATYLVNFNGTGTQNINRSSGTETFYQLTVSSAAATVQMLNDVMVTNTLNMGGANINMNGYALTLGNNAGAALNYTGGIAYGGTWKRWFPASAITSTSGSYYGLFPIGTISDYRYVTLNSTVNPTIAGYVSASHTDAVGVTSVAYTDNEGSLIQAIAYMHSNLSTTTLAGGTYDIVCHFTGFGTSGNVADLKLETYTGNVMGSCGTHVSSIGSVNSPTLQRTGLTLAQLSNSFVVGTVDESSTPLYAYYYSRKTGNWNDVTTGNGTWSFTPGGSGASCDCVPLSGSYVVIDSAHVVTANTSDSVQFIDILNGGALINNISCTFSVSANLTVYGTGTFTNNGTMAITGALTVPSGNSPTASGNVTVGNDFFIPTGGSYTQTGGTLTLNGDVIDSGTLTITSGGSININGSASVISGNGAINDSAGTITVTHNKTIHTGTVLTLGTTSANTTLAIASGTTINNIGNVTLSGSMTGAAASSIWVNNAQSHLTVSGAVLATGVLEASTAPNTVNYNGSGSQTVKAPLSSYYNITATNSGTKSLAATVQVDNALTLGGSVIFDESTNALTGNAALTMSGTAELKLERSVEGTYPELTGTYTLTGGTVTLNQTGDSAILTSAQYYNLKLNGSTPYDISGIFTISNNFDMQGSATLNNNNTLTVGGTFTYASSGYTTLSDNITVSGIVLNSGTLDDGLMSITINGAGGWSRNGGAYNSTGQTIFYNKTGTAQNIGGSTATTFNTLVINNSSDVTLNVSPAAATIVSNVLNLTDGNLITNSTNILRMTDTAIVKNGSASSYVSGPMVKKGSANFIFPVGKSGIYAQAGISNMADATTEVTAEYFPAPYSSLTPVDTSLKQVSHTEYWIISRAVTTDSLQLQLFWTNATTSDLIDCSYLTIAHYTGGKWINEASTAVGGSVCTGTGSGSVQTNGYVTSFSPFTFGGGGGDALPIELISFKALPQGNMVLTSWATQLQLNNAYFTVERSADSKNFNTVGTVDGAGNSTSLLNYQLLDETPLQGVSYYRLRQTDFNGKFTYSNIVSVDMAKTATMEAGNVTIYPNPAHSQASVHITKPAGQILLKVFDVSGWEVYSKTITVDSESDQTIIIPTGILAPGMYIVSTYTGKTTSKVKLVVE